MFVALRRSEPILKMGIKVGFIFRPSDANNCISLHKHIKIRVLHEKRACKGNALAVIFQSFYEGDSLDDTIANQILTKQMRLFVVLKVFESESSKFEDEDFLYSDEKEVECLTDSHTCSFHQLLKDVNQDDHKAVLRNIFDDSRYMPREGCSSCKTTIVPAMKILAEKDQINNQACTHCRPKAASSNDQFCLSCAKQKNDLFAAFYKTLFVPEYQDPSTSKKKPRLDHCLGRYDICL